MEAHQLMPAQQVASTSRSTLHLMSDEPNTTPAPPPSEPAKTEKSVGASIGLSEGQRGINVVNTEPVGGVPNPGGLPAAAPSGDAPTMTAAPAEPAATPPSGE